MRIMDAINFWSDLGTELGLKSRFSMYDEAGMNPDRVGIVGKDLTLVYSDHFGTAGIQSVSLPDNPTWRQLYVAADQVIQNSGDIHHIFIENFSQDKSDPTTYRLVTGS